MTLATHIIAAGVATKPFLGRVSDPIIFVVAILSHYLLDTIPHFDYKLLSIAWNEEGNKAKTHFTTTLHTATIDLLNIGIDIAIGVAFLIILARPEITLTNFITYSLIIIGSILPDALQPIYILWKRFPMTQIQNLHDFWHSPIKLEINKKSLTFQGVLFLIAAIIVSLH